MTDGEILVGDAMRTLSETYHKILKIDLVNDTHIDIKVYDNEVTNTRGYEQKISEWLKNFALTGQVYEKDAADYLRFVDFNNIKAHFMYSDESLRFRYRRLTNGVFRWVMMLILKAGDYTPENQTAMLFIQDIHDIYVEELDVRDELERLCKFDTLTGLKNVYSYRLLCNTVSGMLSEVPIGVLFADLNGLKMINDISGHDAGNEYIIGFSDDLKKQFSRYECFRLGGDEFLVVAIGADEKVFKKRADEFINRIEGESIPRAALGAAFMESGSIEVVASEAEKLMYRDKDEFYEKNPAYKRDAIERTYKEQISSLMEVLSRSYEVLLTVDIEKDMYRIVKQNTTSISAGEPTRGVYTVRNDNFCENFVGDEFRELRRTFGSLENIKKQLKTESHISCDYRLKDGRWRESVFWKTKNNLDGEPIEAVYYSQNIDSSMIERFTHRLEAEKEVDILEGLTEIYRSVSVISLNDERLRLYQNISLPDTVSEIMEDIEYDRFIKEFSELFVSEKDIDNFIEETKLVNIRKRLKTQKAVSVFCEIKPERQESLGSKYEKFAFWQPEHGGDTLMLATRDVTEIMEWRERGRCTL